MCKLLQRKFLLIVQPCTNNSSEARRVEIVYVNLSVRLTDTDKSVSLLSVSFRRSTLRFDPICDRADNYVFWTFLRWLCGSPLKNMQHCTASHAPKRRTKWQYFFMHIFLPLSSAFADLLRTSRLKKLLNSIMLCYNFCKQSKTKLNKSSRRYFYEKIYYSFGYCFGN